MTPLVELDHVSRQYGLVAPVAAVADASLAVERGELVAITGPSGSGKSTLLALMGCLEKPSAGVVRIDGVDVSRLADRARCRVRAATIGFVFQQFHLIPHLSAVENVETALLYQGLPRAVRRARAELALQRVGLAARALHRPREMSGGEQQRVAIARAIVTSPALILADEPTGNLDSVNAIQVLDVLWSLITGEAAVVVATHNETIAARAHRRLRMFDGRITDEAERVA
jgi:putative ABC transport system ATP-binding protein